MSTYQPILGTVLNSILWFIPAILTISALKLLFEPRLKGIVGELAVGLALKDIGEDVLTDILIPDGKGGLTQLDHVVLAPGGLWVIETKNYKGLIFGREREKYWTQRLGRQSFRFMNPLRQNYLHTEALKALLPNVPVHGWVAFAGEARFPKGMPDGVSALRSLRKDLSAFVPDKNVAPDLHAAWKRLKRKMRTDRAAKREHLAGIKEKYGKGRATPVGIGLLVISVAWLLVMWLR